MTYTLVLRYRNRDTYITCSSFAEMQHIARNAVLANIVVLGYADHTNILHSPRIFDKDFSC